MVLKNQINKKFNIFFSIFKKLEKYKKKYSIYIKNKSSYFEKDIINYFIYI